MPASSSSEEEEEVPSTGDVTTGDNDVIQVEDIVADPTDEYINLGDMFPVSCQEMTSMGYQEFSTAKVYLHGLLHV